MGNTLCKISKEKLQNDTLELLDIVLPAKVICQQCARVANQADWVCQPVLLPDCQVNPESDCPKRQADKTSKQEQKLLNKAEKLLKKIKKVTAKLESITQKD